MPFAYTLLVNLPANRRLGSDKAELTIDWMDRPVAIKPRGDSKPIKEAEWLKFTSRDFLDEESARAHGQSLKGHLRLAAVRSHLALNVGRERVVSGPGRTIVDDAAKEGMHLLPSVHGLMVYEQTDNDGQLWMTANGTALTPHDRFVESLRLVAGLSTPADDSRLALACDLYSQAMFETSLAAQFISLVTAIEALVDRGQQPDAVQEVLRDAESDLFPKLSQLAPSLDDSTLQSIKGRIRDLQQESISQAFRRLTATYGNPAGYDGEPPEQFAARVYTLRSRLVHGESVADQLPVAPLMGLVADIILGLAASE